jgi:hypothetical protein
LSWGELEWDTSRGWVEYGPVGLGAHVRHMPALQLADALTSQPAFWEQVEAIRIGRQEAEVIAKRYPPPMRGGGDRNDLAGRRLANRRALDIDSRPGSRRPLAR